MRLSTSGAMLLCSSRVPRTPHLALNLLAQPAREVVDGQANLLHRVAVAHGDGAVFQALEVDREAVGRADLVLAAVAAADGARLVIGDHELAAQPLVDLL